MCFFHSTLLVFGQAIARIGVDELTEEEKIRQKFVYKHKMVFDPINQGRDIFPNPMKKGDLEPLIEKRFGRTFTYLDLAQYKKITRAVGSKPIEF